MVQKAKENLYKDGNTRDDWRCFQRRRICAEGCGDLAEPAADQRQIDQELGKLGRHRVVHHPHRDLNPH